MTPQEVAAIFDARAERYIGDDWHRRYAERFVVATPLRPGDRVLDAGTGTGFAACAIARRVGPSGHVLGVDVSRGMLQQARRAIDAEALTNVELLEADATDLRALAASTFDAVVCAAGLLYMPVANALSAWHRLLKPKGVVAFSTMKAGSPSAGRVFRECAGRFDLDLQDPSEALGTEDQCRSVLHDAGFDAVQVTAGRVDFEHFDPVLAWEANSRAHATARSLSPQALDDLRHQYLRALEEARREDLSEASRADVLFAVARRP
jgi:ubiquinone/menaquinone biosynthesis C-methylase UbiE